MPDGPRVHVRDRRRTIIDQPRDRSSKRAVIAGIDGTSRQRGSTGGRRATDQWSAALSTMALYRYVDDRASLEELVADVVLADVDLRVPDDAPWEERPSSLIERLRAAAAAHPSALPLLVTRRHASATQLRWIEAMLDVLTSAGFDGPDRVVALRALVGYTFGALQLQHLGPLAGAGSEAMARLPAEAYPLLVAVAGEAREVPIDVEFRSGLDALLCGLDALLCSPGHIIETS